MARQAGATTRDAFVGRTVPTLAGRAYLVEGVQISVGGSGGADGWGCREGGVNRDVVEVSGGRAVLAGVVGVEEGVGGKGKAAHGGAEPDCDVDEHSGTGGHVDIRGEITVHFHFGCAGPQICADSG